MLTRLNCYVILCVYIIMNCEHLEPLWEKSVVNIIIIIIIIINVPKHIACQNYGIFSNVQSTLLKSNSHKSIFA